MRLVVTLIALFVIVAFAIGIYLLLSALVNPYGVIYKRRKWILAGVAILLAALFLAGSGLLRVPIDLTRVEKMELHTYDHVRSGQVELTLAERWMIALLYNLSPRGGEITSEPCCDSYRVETYLTDGRIITVSENGASILNVRVRDEQERDDFCAACPLLVDYIFILAEKYDLPMD